MALAVLHSLKLVSAIGRCGILIFGNFWRNSYLRKKLIFPYLSVFWNCWQVITFLTCQRTLDDFIIRTLRSTTALTSLSFNPHLTGYPFLTLAQPSLEGFLITVYGYHHTKHLHRNCKLFCKSRIYNVVADLPHILLYLSLKIENICLRHEIKLRWRRWRF